MCKDILYFLYIQVLNVKIIKNIFIINKKIKTLDSKERTSIVSVDFSVATEQTRTFTKEIQHNY